jgi:hypothetical protein
MACYSFVEACSADYASGLPLARQVIVAIFCRLGAIDWATLLPT